MQQPKPSVHEVTREAMRVFHQNTDTLIAGFLIRHPEIDPGDIVLVTQATPDGFRVFVDAKELHVPKSKDIDTGHQQDNDYARGWNACRQAVIDMTKKYQGGDAEFASIGGANG